MKMRITKWYSIGAGGLDSLTGVGLILLPTTTLGLMNVDAVAYQLELIRFIGAFVFAIGSLYLWGLFSVVQEGSSAGLRMVWWATAWARLCVGLVTGAMIAQGALAVEWLAVPLTDLGMAVFQIGWLSTKGGLAKDE